MERITLEKHMCCDKGVQYCGGIHKVLWRIFSTVEGNHHHIGYYLVHSTEHLLQYLMWFLFTVLNNLHITVWCPLQHWTPPKYWTVSPNSTEHAPQYWTPPNLLDGVLNSTANAPLYWRKSYFCRTHYIVAAHRIRLQKI